MELFIIIMKIISLAAIIIGVAGIIGSYIFGETDNTSPDPYDFKNKAFYKLRKKWDK